MKYITVSDLSNTIRKNLWKIPRDIDFVIGIPRSGMLCASLISSYLNVPLIDIKSFTVGEGIKPYGGGRLLFFEKNHIKTGRALVVDDTVYNGSSMNNAKDKLGNTAEMEFVYMCVYLEGTNGKDAVDIYLEDVRQYTKDDLPIVLYEWNIFQHHDCFMRQFLFDLDGVFCVDPPDERNEPVYQEYIKSAQPLFIPRTPIGGIATYRLIKNKDVTEKWLSSQGITDNHLFMFNANSWEERNNSNIGPALYKAMIYKQMPNYKLFFESDDRQAQEIFKLSNKPVYCVETNKLYQS